jgi:hypothetical protein
MRVATTAAAAAGRDNHDKDDHLFSLLFSVLAMAIVMTTKEGGGAPYFSNGAFVVCLIERSGNGHG